MRQLSWRQAEQFAGLVVIMFLISAFSEVNSQDAENHPSAILRISEEIDVDAVGNVSSHCEIVFPPEAYHAIKKMMSPRDYVQENGQWVVKLKSPKVEYVLRYFGFTTAVAEVQDMKGEFDDEAATIVVNYRIIGRVGFQKGQWVYNVGNGKELNYKVHKSEIQGESVALDLRFREAGMLGILRLKLKLPAGTTNIEFRPKSGDLVYDAPPAQLAEGKSVRKRPEMTLDAKSQLMSVLYKLYGNTNWPEMWVARSLFKNQTVDTLSEFRARFRIEGYSSWSPWMRTDKVFPGQTVVNAYYPIIDSKITNLKGSTPAQMELEFEYTLPGGQRVTETESGRTKLLGMNEALYSNIQVDENSSWYDLYRIEPIVVSSFVSATDPVMLDVVGMISKATGGQGHSSNDETALKFLGTLYNLFRQNIAYETTAGEFRDGLVHQHLKYGRDVLRTRSGTCINLAILYASACETAGIKSYVILGPGHAFAAAKLPKSGEMIYVETTGCVGGTKEKSYTFLQAREMAYRTFQKWTADGNIIQTDIQAIRQSGVMSPELPDLGSNPLKEWGIQPPDVIDQVALPQLLLNVKSALDGVKRPYTQSPDKPVLATDFASESGNQWQTLIQTFEQPEIMVVMSQVPGVVPENQRQKICAFLAEHNTNFYHGNFELSRNGAISFRTSTDVRGGVLTPQMVLSELDVHARTMDKNLPELRKLVISELDGAAQRKAQADQMAASDVLIGKWKTNYQMSAVLITQTVTFSADGKLFQVAIGNNGSASNYKGRWAFKDNTLSVFMEGQAAVHGPTRIVNDNRFIFHDPTSNLDLTYDRVIENK